MLEYRYIAIHLLFIITIMILLPKSERRTTMKKFSSKRLANFLTTKRKKMSLTQQMLSNATGINRALISRIEKEDFLPSIPQLEKLGEVLDFDPLDTFIE